MGGTSGGLATGRHCSCCASEAQQSPDADFYALCAHLLTGLYIPFCPAHQQLPTHQSSPKPTSLICFVHILGTESARYACCLTSAHTCESPPMLLFAHQLRCARAAQVCSLLTAVLACTGQRSSACNLQQDLNVLEVSSPAFLKVFACCEADADEHRGGTDRESVACFV